MGEPYDDPQRAGCGPARHQLAHEKVGQDGGGLPVPGPGAQDGVGGRPGLEVTPAVEQEEAAPRAGLGSACIWLSMLGQVET